MDPDILGKYMNDITVTDWDDAFANSAYIPDADSYIDRWAGDAAAFRKSLMEKDLDVVYGDGPRRRFDVFRPERKSKGLVVFVHGGYWLRFDKSYWSHFAQGSLARGWTVAVPSYDLAQEVSIADISRQIAMAVTKAAARVAGPIRLTGHSAGGHLVTRMISQGGLLGEEVLQRIEKVVSISGLHDLRPLTHTAMNGSFKMSEADAAAESPALLGAASDCPVVAWVGGDERPELIRQSRLLADAWPTATFHEDPERHHFDVIDDLKDPDSPLSKELLSA